MAKAKRMILDGVKDHVVCHIASRGTAREMWDVLSMLYQGSFEQRKMYLEQKLRPTQMQKGECVDPFLMKLQETRAELSVVGSRRCRSVAGCQLSVATNSCKLQKCKLIRNRIN